MSPRLARVRSPRHACECWSFTMAHLYFLQQDRHGWTCGAVSYNMCLALRPGYRPRLQAELQRSVAANLNALQAEREALLKGAQAAPAN